MKIIEVNGKQHTLRLDLNALCDFKELTGTDITKVSEDLELKDIRILFHLALQSGSSSYEGDIKDSGRIIGDYISENGDGFVGIGELLSELINGGEVGKQKNRAELLEVVK